MSAVVSDAILAKLDRARVALAEAKTIQEAKKLHDVAASAEVFAKHQGMAQEAIDYAHAIKIEALRRLGEMLAETKDERAKGTAGRVIGPGRGKVNGGSEVAPPFPDAPPTLADLGLTKKTSSIAQKLADLPPEQFEQVRAGTASVSQAIREVTHARRPAVVPPVGKYRVIYADPPWSYGNSGLQEYGHASHHFPCMTIEALCALPVRALSENNAVLFLWVTSPLLAECFAVIEAWGFTYKTSFVWDKVKHNFGHYNSVRHEMLLVCTRGSCTPDVKTLHDSVQTIERSPKHSEKPEEFRAIIDELYPNGSRIELFARASHQGWTRWGNE